MFTYKLETGGAIVSKFSCWGKNLGRGSWVEARKLAFFFSRGTLPAMRHSKQIGHCDGTGQAIGAHTGAGGQCALRRCADETETGVGADGPVHDTDTHTTHGHGIGGLGWAKSKTGLPT